MTKTTLNLTVIVNCWHINTIEFHSVIYIFLLCSSVATVKTALLYLRHLVINS